MARWLSERFISFKLFWYASTEINFSPQKELIFGHSFLDPKLFPMNVANNYLNTEVNGPPAM
jgi:hypothetical protein